MNTLRIKVNGNNAEVIDGLMPASGERKFSQLKFIFDDEWNKVAMATITMFFSRDEIINQAVTVVDNTCTVSIPDELSGKTGNLYVGVSGAYSENDVVEISTHLFPIRVGQGVVVADKANVELYKSILDAIADMVRRFALLSDFNTLKDEIVNARDGEETLLARINKIVSDYQAEDTNIKELISKKLDNKSNVIISEHITPGAVTNEKICKDAVTTNSIANNAITTEKITAGSVTTSKIANDSVSNGHLMDNSVNENKIADGAVTESKLANLSITAEKIANNAVTTDKIGLQAVTFNKIAENAVLNKHILDGSIKESKIADGAVTNEKLANLSITTEKIADNAITTKAILDGTVTTEKIVDEAIISGKIKDESIIESKIANEAVTNSKLAKNSVTTDKIKIGSVTSSKLASDAVNENVLNSDLKAKINSKLDTPDIEGIAGQVLMHTGGNKPVWGTVSGGSGGTGTSNYLELENKPSINDVSLVGNITLEELGIKNGSDGTDGVGIKSIEQTTTSTSDNGINVINIVLTDDTQSTVTVKNGSKGSPGLQGEKGDTGSAGKDGKDGVGIENIETSISSEDNGLNPIVITLTDGTEYTVYTKNGSKGSQGTSVKVKSVATSLEDDGNNIVKFTDGSTLTIKNGSKGSQGETGASGTNGKDGYTPVKGTDYWTNEDKAELKAMIQSGLSQIEPNFANSIEECTDESKVYVLPDGFIYAYIKTTSVKPAYTNKVPTSKDASGSVYNGSGYKEGYRLNSSGTETTLEGAVCSGFIPITKGDVIYILSDASNASNTAHYFDTYDSSFAKLSANGGANIGTWSTLNGRYLWTIDTSALSVTPAYFRCSTCSSGVDFIVSVNEPLDGKETTVETYAWTNTGHAFVPADYEERIINLEEDVADLKNTNKTSIGIPYYVSKEAEVVADKVLSVRNAYSFVFGAVSDTHTTGNDASATSVLHAGMGMDKINEFTQFDLVTNFGDVMVGYFDDTYKEGFKLVKSAFNGVSKAVPYIQLQGNHDQLSADTTEEAQQKYFAYIGANNVGTVTDWTNRFRNYGYRDFDDQKMRVIYLNTTDVSEVENTQDVGISSEQYSWLINTALDFSNKDDAENWGFIVCSHHPLNWYYLDNLLVLLNAYKGKTSGSITTDDTSIAYDFTNATAELIAHFHGHLHNFRVEKLGENEITTITIPNACFDRNNEYGTHSDSEIRNLYGDADENGNQRQFNKTANTAKDTAFNVIVVDRQNRKIHCFNYGAGIDREIGY